MSGVEMWQPVPGQSGYEVSDQGRVRSPRGAILKPWVSNKAGHLKVGLGGRNREWVHRLACLAFRGPCPDGLEVRHLDGNPQNNALANLRYGTHSENMLDRADHGTVPLRYGDSCPRGHTYGADRICWECQFVAKKRWVTKNVGVYVECDNCGRSVSKLNLKAHKSRRTCQQGVAA